MSHLRDNTSQLREAKMSTSERTALADVQNISHNRSIGSQKSRDSRVNSPAAPLNRRLLTQDMFDDSGDEAPVEKPKTFAKNVLDGIRSSHSNSTLRRTKSDFSVDNAMDCSSYHSHLSVNMSHFDLSDMQIELDDVFMEDMSPNISAFSNASIHHPRIHDDERATASCFAVNRAPSPENFQDYMLDGVDNPQTPSRAYRSISPHVLAKLLKDYGASFAEKFMLVDCRYPYEYAGGHIKGAVNVSNPDLIEGIFFPPNTADDIWAKLPIFYCEFSQKRGPAMAHKLRSLDRRLNELAYPHLNYNEIYLVDGGYNNFWSCGVYKSLCEPSAYVAMLDETYEKDLAKYDAHKKKADRRIKIFSRHESLLNLNEDTVGTAEMHKATSLANVSFGSTGMNVKKRLDFDFD